MTTTSFSRRTMLRLAAWPPLAATLAACVSAMPGGEDDNAPSTQPGPATGPAGAGTIGTGRTKVGLILPLSGPGQATVAGTALRNAAELAVTEFQNPDIQIIVEDDRGTADGARAAAQALLSQGAELILGPLFAASVQAASQVTRAAGKPMIAFSSDASAAARGVYLLSFLAENEVERIVDFATMQGRKSFLALVPETPYGRVAEAAFQQAVAAKGARLAGLERFSGNSPQAALQRLAQAAGQADAIFLPEGGEQLVAISQALQASGIDTRRIKPLGTGIWNDARVFRAPTLAGGWFSAPESAGFDAFAGRYRARFGSDPTRIATLSYDAVSLAAALTRTQGAQRFTEQVLTNASGFSGADGVFRFRQNGLNERGLAVLEIRNGAAVTVSAAPRTLAGA